jgi:LDH2 family malate/lactate/ureidoglycolate dehydrogenase
MTQIIVKTSELERLMKIVCKKQGLSEHESQLIIDTYLEAEFLGKRTHGIAKFNFESQHFSERNGQPFIVVDTGPLLKVDGNREVGPIAAEYSLNIASQRAKKYGISIVGINNMQRYGILKTWINKLARQNLFGVLLNTCEPAMVGYQGKQKVLGTNPIAFPILTKARNYVVDMATSKVAMSMIWEAQREQTTLPSGTFYDINGNLTTDPKLAKAVLHFGDLKGFNIALLIQLLSGSVFGFKMASHIRSIYDIGYVFLVIDPSKTTNISSMLGENQDLVDELIKSGSVIPGNRSENTKKPKEISLQKIVFDELQRLRRTTK